MTNEEKLRVLEREVAEWVKHRDFMHRAEPSGWVSADNLALAEEGAEAMTWALAIVKAAVEAKDAIRTATLVFDLREGLGDEEIISVNALLSALNEEVKP